MIWSEASVLRFVPVLTVLVIVVAILLGLLDAWSSWRQNAQLKAALSKEKLDKEALESRIRSLELALRVRDARVRLIATAMEDMADDLARKAAEVRVCDRENEHLRAELRKQEATPQDDDFWQINLEVESYPPDDRV